MNQNLSMVQEFVFQLDYGCLLRCSLSVEDRLLSSYGIKCIVKISFVLFAYLKLPLIEF